MEHAPEFCFFSTTSTIILFGYLIIQRLKANSSRLIRKKYSVIREFRYTPDFWASGFYVGTAGHVTAENVADILLSRIKN